jgi:flavin-dependent dehydrogenase
MEAPGVSDQAVVRSNIDFDEAASRSWDAIVVGAGIAGTSLAAALASGGQSVLLLEKSRLPRDKTCGGCLNGRALASFERLKLLPAVEALKPPPVRGIVFQQGVRQARADYPAWARSVAVTRRSLDATLAREAIRKGAAYLDQAQVTDSRVEENRRVVCVRDSQNRSLEIRAGVVIACDGLGSGLAKSAGLEAKTTRGREAKMGVSAILPPGALDLPPHLITMSCHAAGYVGAVRAEGGAWDVAGALRGEFIREAGGPWLAVKRVLASAGVEANVLPEDVEVSTCPALRRQTSRRWAERLLLVGDAAGYVEPVTGEGMAWALASVEEAAKVLAEGWNFSSGARYEAAWRRRVAGRRGTVRMSAWMLDQPWRTSAALMILNAAPWLGRAIAGRLNRGE